MRRTFARMRMHAYMENTRTHAPSHT
jgi:hypothetical protein